ncbi:MAG TPA: hypothetical protein VK635_10715 [Bradyrhizobium sp.]|nr:hypothetical protein [Bradyrhizobium sp.]
MASRVGRVDDEAGIAGLRVVGQHVEPCPMEEGGVVRFRNAVADRSRQQQATDNRASVDRRVGYLPDAVDDDLEILRDVYVDY